MEKIEDSFCNGKQPQQQQNEETHTKLDRQQLIDYVAKDWKLDSTHGLSHWLRVEKNGIMLSTPEVNPYIVTAFAFLHDSCRVDNGYDVQHGVRALTKIDEIRHTILKNFTDQEIDRLKTACRYHTTKARTNDMTVNVCFDADRLDLLRVGILPDPKKMATPQGAAFAEHYNDFIRQREERWGAETTEL